MDGNNDLADAHFFRFGSDAASVVVMVTTPWNDNRSCSVSGPVLGIETTKGDVRQWSDVTTCLFKSELHQQKRETNLTLLHAW